ncbi:hypothetical protein GCM10018966_044930 [Streptomyces yanii]
MWAKDLAELFGGRTGDRSGTVVGIRRRAGQDSAPVLPRLRGAEPVASDSVSVAWLVLLPGNGLVPVVTEFVGPKSPSVGREVVVAVDVVLFEVGPVVRRGGCSSGRGGGSSWSRRRIPSQNAPISMATRATPTIGITTPVAPRPSARGRARARELRAPFETSMHAEYPGTRMSLGNICQFMF